MLDQPQRLLIMSRKALWVREEHWLSSTWTWERLLTASLTVWLFPQLGIALRLSRWPEEGCHDGCRLEGVLGGKAAFSSLAWRGEDFEDTPISSLPVVKSLSLSPLFIEVCSSRIRVSWPKLSRFLRNRRDGGGKLVSPGRPVRLK